MYSLCSGCIFYYTDDCPKSLDEKASTNICSRFHFVPTSHFRKSEDLLRYLAETGRIPTTKDIPLV